MAPPATRRARLCSLALAVLLCGCGSAWQGPVTAHFDGRRFNNPGHQKTSSVLGYLQLRLTTPQGDWPEGAAFAAHAPPPARVNDGTARVTLVGHATVLIQTAGLNILTDPLWSERASPVSFAGPRRVAPPGVAFDALPPIDVVLISHDHYDHLDLATLRRLDARDRPRVLAPLGNRRLLVQAMPSSDVSEHDWGDRVALVPGVAVHVEPMLHGSGRGLFDQQATLWAAFVVEAAGLKIFHVGDSGYGDGAVWQAARRKHGAVDLAVVPIGAWEPASFMADSHMSPAQAVRLASDLGARRAMAHHFEAFQLGFEAHGAARAALQAALVAAKSPAGWFAAPQPGEVIVLRPPAAAR